MADVIIVGGGLCGTVVASRLHQQRPSLSIVLVEAGPDPSDHPHVKKPADGVLLHFSDLDYKFFTTPQAHLDGKPKYNCAVKALGGGTVINYGGWIRGDAQDYDEWAREVGDKRWSYDGLLPYFKRSERHHDRDADPSQHGFEGPIHTASVTSSGRKFPLREDVLKLWSNLGLEYKHDLNDGKPQSISDLVENWRDGKRQIAPSVYPLDGVKVLTGSTVRRICLNDSNVATGVELVSGEIIDLKENGQIVLSAGAYKTPQVLMLSGIGNKEQLIQHGISAKVDLPAIGQNLHDHILYYRYWKLRHPERGLAVGSPLFDGPNYEKGGPIDFMVRSSVPGDTLKDAISKDEGSHVSDEHPLIKGPRTHLEHGLLYAPWGADAQGISIPVDGASIGTFCMTCLPTSRGSITLASSDPLAPPVIDPNYLATETDRHVLREAFRMHSRLMLDTPEGQGMVAGEHVPDGFPVLTSSATDEQIDARLTVAASTCFHPAGTAAMGKVVDTALKVFGVQGLRVVDASIVPKPLAAHYQAPLYAIAEQAADIIAKERIK